MQQPPPGNPNLPGLSTKEVVLLSEKLHTIGNDGFLLCSKKCVTHFAEDAIPYHPGEKSCMDRCINKVYAGFDMAKAHRKEFEIALRKDDMPFSWMRDLAKAQNSA